MITLEMYYQTHLVFYLQIKNKQRKALKRFVV